MGSLENRLERLTFGALPEQLDALENGRARLRLLLEVSESIASHREVATLLQDLAQLLPHIVPFDVINVVLHDPVRNSMRLHALVAPEFNKTRRGLEFSIDETTPKFVWENQQAVMVEDVEEEKNFTTEALANGSAPGHGAGRRPRVPWPGESAPSAPRHAAKS